MRRILRTPGARHILGLVISAMGLSTWPSNAIELNDVYREVMEKNPSVQAAAARIERARGQRLSSRSIALPDLRTTLNLGYLGERQDRNAQLFALNVTDFRQPLFNMAIPPTYRQADARLAAAEFEYLNTCSNQLLLARNRWIRLGYSAKRLQILRQNAALLDANLKAARESLEAGLSGDNEPRRAEIQRLQMEPLIQSTEAAMKEASIELALIMGRPMGPNVAVSSLPRPADFPEFAPFNFDFNAAKETALRQRADLAVLAKGVEVADFQVRIAEAGYYPQVNAVIAGDIVPSNALQNQNSTAVRQGDDDSTTEFRYGVRYDWAVWDGGATLGQSREARAREVQAAELWQQAIDEIPRQLLELKAGFDAANTTFPLLQKQIGNAMSATRIVEAEITEGLATQTDFLQVQTAQLELELQLLAIQLSQQQQLAMLEWVLGSYIGFTEEQP